MRWYKNLKVGMKLIIGYIIVAMIAGVIGVIGIVNIMQIEEADKKLYETMTVPLGETVYYVESYQRLIGNVKDILLADTEEAIKDYEGRIELRRKEFTEEFDKFSTTLLTDYAEKNTMPKFIYDM